MFNFEINFLVCNADTWMTVLVRIFLRKFELKSCEWNYIGLDHVAPGVLQGTVLGLLLYSLYMLQLTKKHDKIQAFYTLGSTDHEHVKASNISVLQLLVI